MIRRRSKYGNKRVVVDGMSPPLTPSEGDGGGILCPDCLQDEHAPDCPRLGAVGSLQGDRQWKGPTNRITFGLNGQTFTVNTKKRSKYGNRKVVVDGVTIDSGREARRWAELQIFEKTGLIRDLVRQPVFVLAPSVKIVGEARARPAVRYRADAKYVEPKTGRIIVEDTKSPSTAMESTFRLKQHLMQSVHGISVRIVK